MRKSLALVAVGLSLLAGCGGSTPPSLNANELRSVPVQVQVGGQTLTGATNLWRDMMPSPDPGPRGLIASFQLGADAGATLPNGLSATRVSAALGDQVWTTTALEQSRDAASLRITARSGPEWAIGSKVDVVVTFIDSAQQSYSLRAIGQVVQGAF